MRLALDPRLLKTPVKGQPMNSKYDPRKTFPLAARSSVALAVTLYGAVALAQTTITPITVPGGSSLAVSGLNTNGHVAGYYLASDATQRAFFWAAGTGVDLGSLGGSITVANGLNNLGQVVGYAATPGDASYNAFVWSGGTLVDLGTLGGTTASAVAINDAGQMTGYSYLSPISLSYHAIRGTGAGLADLGSLGGAYSSGNAINSSGQVVGESSLSGNFQNHAFLSSGAGMVDLGTLGGSDSSAFAVNDAGHVTGQANLFGDARTHAFLFNGTSMLNLGTLGGTYSGGYKINNAGQVAGDSSMSGDVDYHGFLYSNGSMLDLGTLGGANSSAWGLNNLGHVVGVASDASGADRAYVFKDGVMTDLNTLLPANSGWELSGAYFVDDYGHIVGTGLFQGQANWFLLTISSAQNHPPVADAGADQSLECSQGGAVVALNGGGSSDPDGDALTYEWLEGTTLLANGVSANVALASGVHSITLRVTDPQGLSAEDSLAVVVGDTTAPAVVCPPASSVPVGNNCSGVVPDFLTTLVASDNCTVASALVKSQNPAAGTLVSSGVHQVVLTVTDAAGLSTICTATFTVADVTSPVVQAPAELTRRVLTACQVEVPNLAGEIVASDNCTPVSALTVTQVPAPGTPVGLGNHPVQVTVTDAAGNATSKIVVLRVVDATKPVIHSLSASPNVLSPANKKMVPVTLSVVATDNCDAAPVSRIVSVTSNEAIDGSDWVITGNLALELRAEVLSKNSPRVYTIKVCTVDASGNSTCQTVQVTVPKGRNSGLEEVLTQVVPKVNSGKKK